MDGCEIVFCAEGQRLYDEYCGADTEELWKKYVDHREKCSVCTPFIKRPEDLGKR